MSSSTLSIFGSNPGNTGNIGAEKERPPTKRITNEPKTNTTNQTKPTTKQPNKNLKQNLKDFLLNIPSLTVNEPLE